MVSVCFKGSPLSLSGSPPQKGSSAPDFKFVTNDLGESNLYSFSGKHKVIMAVPSLDTGVCQMQVRVFNKKLSTKSGVLGVVVSKDLPFAMKRFCETEGLNNIVNASDFRYNDFSKQYKIEMMDGPLKALLARAVFITDQNNQIVYHELVPEITKEPDYDKAMNALEEALGS